jgi:hypothetical protein
VKLSLIGRHALHHQKVGEVPVHDDWERSGQCLIEIEAVSAGVEAVVPGSAHDAGGLAAIARHAASDAQLLQRHPPAVVRQDDGERGGTALGDLHLQDGRCPDATPP